MTICLGLLCERATKVVAVADRMISVDFLSLEFEQRTKKVEQLSSHFVALTAGDAVAHTEIIRRARQYIATLSEPTVEDVVSRIEQHFIEARHKLAENTVLRPAGLDYATFIEQQRNLVPEVVAGLVDAYQKVELELEVLVSGVDSSGAHLYLVSDPGVTNCFDAIGYIAIGSGLPHAEGFLSEADYSPMISLNQALWLCYMAKRRSERAPGVGSRFTDILLVDAEHGVQFLDEGALKKLEAIRQQYLKAHTGAERRIQAAIDGLALSYEGGGPV